MEITKFPITRKLLSGNMLLPMDKMLFTERMEEILNEKGMTKADLARISGIAPSHITRIMRGEQAPGIDNIVAIAQAIGKKPEVVFSWLAGISKNHQEPEYVPFQDEWNTIFYELTPDERQELLDFGRIKVARRKAKALAQTSPPKQSSRGKKSPARSALVEE